WNGASTTINDAVSLATLQRNPGENAGNYAITNGTLALTGTLNGANNPAVAGNYTTSFSTTNSQLTVNPSNLTGTVANQTKVYGTDDPALASITPTLTGLVNRTVSTWNGNVVVDDSALANASTTLTLARGVGENVGSYNINGGTFSAPSTNYNAPTFTGTPTLTITPASLTVSLTNPAQTKVYGTSDPALGGIGMTLTGLVNNPAVSTWNGTVAVNDSAVTGTAASLTRAHGGTAGSHHNTIRTAARPANDSH